MRIGDLCTGIMCGVGVAARLTELKLPAPVIVVGGIVMGGMAALMVDELDENYRRIKKQKRAAVTREVIRRDRENEYLPPGIVRVNDRLTYARTVEPRYGYRRCGDSFTPERKERKPASNIQKLCGALYEDYARLPEEGQRALFKGELQQ